MVWSKLDDGILDHPKIAAVGPIGFALFVAGLVYSNRNLTDGFIPYGVARRLLSTEWTEDGDAEEQIWSVGMVSGGIALDASATIDRTLAVLCSMELWERLPNGYLIRDFPDYNPSKDAVMAERAAKAAGRAAGGRARDAGASRDDKGRYKAAGQSSFIQQLSSLTSSSAPADDQLDIQEPSSPVPVPVPKELKPLHAPRARDLVFDALAEVCGIDVAQATRREKGGIGKAASEIRGATDITGWAYEAVLVLVRGRSAQYRRRYPGAAMTPNALAMHWGECAAPVLAPVTDGWIPPVPMSDEELAESEEARKVAFAGRRR